MNAKNNLLTLFLFFAAFSLNAQINIPFFEDFNNDFSFVEPDTFALQIAGRDDRYALGFVEDPNPNSPSWRDQYFEWLSDTINGPKGYSIDFGEETNNKYLKLTVNPGDMPPNGNGNERAETGIGTRFQEGKTTFFSYNFRIPLDDTFTDVDDHWLMIGQLISGSKSFSVEYVNDTSLNDNEKRSLFLPLYDTKEIRRGNVRIKNAIKKGVWHEIILKVKASKDEIFHNVQDINDFNTDNGYLSIWIDKKPVILEKLFFDDTNRKFSYDCKIGNTNDNEARFMHSTIRENEISRILNIKFGQYRMATNISNTVHFDNLRITDIFPDNRTKLKSEHCNAIVPIDNYKLHIYKIIGATEYVAQFESGGEINYVGMGNSTEINLNYLNFLEAGKTYNVRVRAKGVTNSGYGESCTITIPSKTKLKTEYCNVIVSTNNNTLKVYEIPGATEYVARFESNGEINYAGMGNSTTLNLNYINFLESGKTYNVRIHAKGVVNSGYGESCSVTESNFGSGNENLAPDHKISGSKKHSNYKEIIYPNPFKDFLHLDFQNNYINAELYNTKGSSILNINFKNSTSINLSELSTGIYFLKIINMDNEVIIHKLIKN
ncbi:heparin lyase I family protein [Aquimarina spongiae]|uniref:Por secretion system C-terminal sorting domain-containing protein n=1 Tax=Aquimarina spongiae TaxID=570521 RepID=A0A1M6I1M2_9FLAO|nr:heparin lyase I family protein [Aquimarina spongiae]SHJ28341.1 Por secretion system C-terminal sorting domain-containing protein [Aquimarina spongiae]